MTEIQKPAIEPAGFFVYAALLPHGAESCSAVMCFGFIGIEVSLKCYACGLGAPSPGIGNFIIGQIATNTDSPVNPHIR